MSSEICPRCDGSGYVEVVERVRPGRWATRLQPTGFGYSSFAMQQVWEPGSGTRESLEICEFCNGQGLVSAEELARALEDDDDF